MDLIETKKNLRTYLRFFNKNIDEGSILTYIKLTGICEEEVVRNYYPMGWSMFRGREFRIVQVK